MISKVYLYSNSECCAVANGALTTYTVISLCLATFPIYLAMYSISFDLATYPPITGHLSHSIIIHLASYKICRVGWGVLLKRGGEGDVVMKGSFLKKGKELLLADSLR
jgi:hypothetical protein